MSFLIFLIELLFPSFWYHVQGFILQAYNTIKFVILAVSDKLFEKIVHLRIILYLETK